jgi:hypothetical protein
MNRQERIAIRLVHEGLITAAAAARLIPTSTGSGDRRHVTRSSVIRLIVAGRLEGLRAADWVTSVPAIARFLASRTARAVASRRDRSRERLGRTVGPNLPRSDSPARWRTWHAERINARPGRELSVQRSKQGAAKLTARRQADASKCPIANPNRKERQ